MKEQTSAAPSNQQGKSLGTGVYAGVMGRWEDKYGNINGNNLLDRPFQIVLGLHRARSQVIEHFDLTPCKCLARIDENSEFIIEALPSFVLALTHMSFFVDFSPGQGGLVGWSVGIHKHDV